MRDNSGVFFDSFADKFDTIYDGQRNIFMQWVDKKFRSDIFIRYQMTFNALGDLSGKSVLDVGCGSGPYIAQAIKQGAKKVCGIDAAPSMLSLARQRVSHLNAPNSVEFIEGYFPNVKPSEPCDYGIVMGVMDYISDPIPFVISLHKSITTSAVLSFPSVHWIRTPFRKLRYDLRKCPVFFYTQDSISKIMAASNIRSYSIEKIPGAGMDFFVRINK